MLGFGFLFSQFLPIEILVFDEIFYTPLKISTSCVQIKKILPPIFFVKFWGFENSQIGRVLDKVMRDLKNLFILLRALRECMANDPVQQNRSILE